MLKFQCRTDLDAYELTLYLADRGYDVRQFGTAAVCRGPVDQADYSVVMVTWLAYTVDPSEWDLQQMTESATI